MYGKTVRELSEVSQCWLQSIGSQASPVQLSARDKFLTDVYIPVIDGLISTLENEISAYELIYERFNLIGELIFIKSDDGDEKTCGNIPKD